MCDMNHSYLWRDVFMCATWLIPMSNCVEWLIHIYHVTHPYVSRDSFTCVTQFMHNGDKTHSYVWHNSCISVTWLIPAWGKTIMSRRPKWHLRVRMCVQARTQACVCVRVCVCVRAYVYICVRVCVFVWPSFFRGRLSHAWMIWCFLLSAVKSSSIPEGGGGKTKGK